MDADLELIIRDRSIVFLPADIKSWLAMTFRGLEFCHRNWILHRVSLFLGPFDAVQCHSPPLTFISIIVILTKLHTYLLGIMQDLKPNNLLIASDGQLKIADFGLARDFADPGYKMTCQVITR